MKKEIFSQEALARLRSPDQLDTHLTVTQPIGWMALLTLCCLVASIVVWSIFGVFSVSVESVGMIIDPAGVVNIFHDNTGKIEEILVRPGLRVRKGDVVARISQPSLENNIITNRQNLALSVGRQQVQSALSNFDSTVNQWELSTNIVSAYDGLVTEVQVNQGDIVVAGSTSICSIRQDQEREDVVAIMYVSLDSGKRVRPGMVVQLVPSGVDTKEDGSLMGVVREVSLYPVSSAGIQRVLGNADVVQWILKRTNGAAMEVRVDLVRDDSSSSGYLWSSLVGRRPPVTVGSSCSGSIVVDRRPPISRIFLKFSQWIRNS